MDITQQARSLRQILTRRRENENGPFRAAGKSAREQLSLPRRTIAGRRGALLALLFRQAFWHRDLSKYVSGRPRNLPGWWPQGDIGVVIWSISAVAADWQNAATLTALCTVPDDTMPTAAHWDPAATMFARHILDPLRWFGLVEYRGPEVSFDVRWRKTALFDRFLSFDVRFADGRTKGH